MNNNREDEKESEKSERDYDRRSFLKSSGGAAVVGAIGSVTGNAQAQINSSDFDIDAAFAAFMRDIGQDANDGGGKVTFIGRDPMLHSRFRIASCMALPAMAAAVGAAAIYRERTGEGQDCKLRLSDAIYNVNPLMTLVMRQRRMAGAVPKDDPLTANMNFVPTVNGRPYQAALGVGNPFSFVPFQTKDGRFMNITGIYPHLMNRALEVIKAHPTRESLTRVIKQWDSGELEDALAKKRAVAAMHRTTAEWLDHPEGAYLATRPLIAIEKIGDSEPMPFPKGGDRPLSGLKALSLTHVIAGTTASRTLAEYGAEVLHVARDQSFEFELLSTDVNVGMRSTWLNLNKKEDSRALSKLVPQADVFVESYRGRAIEKLGFGREQVAEKRPGIVYLSVRGYGWDGPWRDRGGFDMEALTVSGGTMIEGGEGSPEFWENNSPTLSDNGITPEFPPTLVLNDYIAGYLGAAGIIAALRRRAKEGGSYHVQVSLSRAAMWYASLGLFPNKEFDPNHPDHKMIDPETVVGKSPYGKIHRLAPMVQLSRTPGRWRNPLVEVRGSSLPVWES